MVQALNHAKHGVDILSGTRVRTCITFTTNSFSIRPIALPSHHFANPQILGNRRSLALLYSKQSYFIFWQVRTHFARPNWKEVFTKIASKHPNATVGKDTLPNHRIFFLTKQYATMHAYQVHTIKKITSLATI